MSSPTISDKFFWHGYIPFYESFFRDREFANIAEFGIHKGASTRWLLERFPNSRLYSGDIVSRQPEWPVDTRWTDVEMDQGNIDSVRNFLKLASFDLIIEDGSHIPEHQVLCLLEGMKALNAGGIYILEDIHTSKGKPIGNALSVLLAIDHFRKIGKEITLTTAEMISRDSLMSCEDVMLLSEYIDSIHLYKRTRLPDYCTGCLTDANYDYSRFRCRCGNGLLDDNDSMSFVIVKK